MFKEISHFLDTEDVCMLYGYSAQFLIVALGDTYSIHCVLTR